MLKVWKVIVSLRLTVILFLLSAALVFFGTLAQKQSTIWDVITRYFWSWYVLVPNQLLVEFFKIFGLGFVGPSASLGGSIPIPGGKLLALLLFINLLAGFLKVSVRDWKYPSRRWRLPGIALLHLGLLLLMVGEFVTREFAIEGQMSILNGASSNFIERRDKAELVFLRPDEKHPEMDRVVSIPGSMLEKAAKSGKEIKDDRLPFTVKVVEYQPNSRMLEKLPEGFENPADKGDGLDVAAKDTPPVSGTDPEQRVDLPSAYIKLSDPKTGQSMGTFLVSTWLSSVSDRKTQMVDIGAKDQNPRMTLRFLRVYKPYTITLRKFIHDVYPGTDTPKNFQSDITLEDPSQGVSREVSIKMNDPMRHAGETFFQSSWLPGDSGTVLQVVQNPGWTIPYISCVMVSLGMLIHFGAALWTFLAFGGKRSVTKNTMPPREKTAALPGWAGPTLVWSIIALVGTVAYSAATSTPPLRSDAFDFDAFGELPMLEGGRVKPIDTLARNRLMLFSQRQDITDPMVREGKKAAKIEAIQWLLEVMTSRLSDNSRAESLPMFRIDYDQVRELLKLDKVEGLRYSINDIRKGGKFEEFFAEASRASKVEPQKRDKYQERLLHLANNLQSWLELQSLGHPDMLPPEDWDGRTNWMSVGDVLTEVRTNFAEKKMDGVDPAKLSLAGIFLAYSSNQPKQFNEQVNLYKKAIEKRIPSGDIWRAELEFSFNRTQPFYLAMYFYGFSLFCTLLGWLAGAFANGNSARDPGALFHHAAWALALQGFLIHTAGLIFRMIITQRPPVTNLYTSAIFIGWGACALGMLVEYILRRGLGNILSAAIGISTLILAQNLAAGGDTMEVLQAVLDTNFWLATHVTTITLGYSATLAAGTVGCLYVVARTIQLFFPSNPEKEKRLDQVAGKMVYGITCFAMLLSFVGTVLGGIWADQSWGRFWGWDPKENGAVLIVIWNALLLHARWAGLVKTPGMSIIAITGSMVTAWSWFGTNQLGVGLHAYGFNNALASGCAIFWLSQLFLILLATILSLKDRTDALASKNPG